MHWVIPPSEATQKVVLAPASLTKTTVPAQIQTTAVLMGTSLRMASVVSTQLCLLNSVQICMTNYVFTSDEELACSWLFKKKNNCLVWFFTRVILNSDTLNSFQNCLLFQMNFFITSQDFCLIPVACTPGTYNLHENNTCESCPQNMYQEEYGQSACAQCPQLTGTESENTKNASDCIGEFEEYGSHQQSRI